jgi:hypothetical protein
MAAHKDLDKLGHDFLDQVISSYIKGLAQDDSRGMPNILRIQTLKNQNRVREKIQNYALNRIDPNTFEFTPKMMEEELSQFRFRNLDDETVAPFLPSGDREVSDQERERVKRKLFDETSLALENHFGDTNVSIHHIAVLKRKSGGSAGLQRFWLSIQVRDSDNNFIPMIVELKRNSRRSGWTDTFENSLSRNSSARYEFALNTAHSERGSAEAVVHIGGLDYLLRIKGAPDVETKNKEDLAAVILYNAYLIGRYHGSQGPKVSAPYFESVKSNKDDFVTFIKNISVKIFEELQRSR